MWETKIKRGKYYRRWKPDRVEAFEILVIALAVIFLFYQFVIRG